MQAEGHRSAGPEGSVQLDWDPWLPGSAEGFYCSGAWTSLMQDTEGFVDQFAVAQDAHGDTIAVVLLSSAKNGTTNPLYDLGRHARELTSSPSQTIVGPHSGYANTPIVRGPSDLPSWGDLVQRTAATAAGEWVGIPFLRQHHAQLIAPHIGHHRLMRALGRCQISMGFASFDEYLQSISASRRSTVRSDIKAFNRGGSQVLVHALEESFVPEMAPLLANVQHHHGSQVTLATVEAFLQGCAASPLAAESVVFSCRRGAEVIGFSLFFRFRNTLILRVVGLEYERVHDHKEYFTAMLYAPIRFALERSIDTIDLGTEGFRTKMLRGAEYVPLTTALLRAPAAFTEREAQMADERLTHALIEEIGDLTDVRGLGGDDQLIQG